MTGVRKDAALSKNSVSGKGEEGSEEPKKRSRHLTGTGTAQLDSNHKHEMAATARGMGGQGAGDGSDPCSVTTAVTSPCAPGLLFRPDVCDGGGVAGGNYGPCLHQGWLQIRGC